MATSLLDSNVMRYKLQENALLLLENASRGDINAPQMCALYADLTPETFLKRADRLADIGYLDRIVSKSQPATYAISDRGRQALRNHAEAKRAEVVARTGTWQPR